jgi:radical SAM superfamily enzyme YgiQ (UPF0313 family)
MNPPICLIIPPSVFLLDERVFMTIGILKVAAVLEAHGRQVELLDLSGVANYEEAVADHAKVSEAIVYGITATTPQLPAATKIARVIRALDGERMVVLGGPHATLTAAAHKHEVKRKVLHGRAERALARLTEEFDKIVAGDGEDGIFRALEVGPKLVDADDPKSPMFLTSKRLTEMPLPARHLLDVKSYHYKIDGHEAVSLIAQLGCPYGCGFCAGRDSPFLRRIRTRTTESIVAELVHLYGTYGFTGFMFYDDELNVNKTMVELMNSIADTQERLGTKWALRGFIKSELFTDEQAEALVRAGFKWILVGFESGSDRILTNINKRATKAENTRCVEIAHKHGLKVKALMSIGHPGESLSTVCDTRDWLLEVKPDDFDVTIITPYPGSPYYDHATLTKIKTLNPEESVWQYEFNGDKLYQVELDYTETADYYKGAPDGGYVAYVWTDYLTSKSFVRVRDHVENEVREKLNIPFNPSAPALQYEHSMGQGLPSNILRKTY